MSRDKTRLPRRLWRHLARRRSVGQELLPVRFCPHRALPDRQGLFFCRRQRISIMRSSSSSRQRTGSSWPSWARRVRSRPYFSLGRLPREVFMRGWAGRTSCPESWRHSRAACVTSIPSSASQTLAVQAQSSSMAHSRCSFSARGARAALAPKTANSSALRVSGARSLLLQPYRCAVAASSPGTFPQCSLCHILAAQKVHRRARIRLQHRQQNVPGIGAGTSLSGSQCQRTAYRAAGTTRKSFLKIEHKHFPPWMAAGIAAAYPPRTV